MSAPFQTIPRLQRIRDDILAAPYHLCTHKAEALTAQLQSGERGRHERLRRLHGRLWMRRLPAQLRGEPTC